MKEIVNPITGHILLVQDDIKLVSGQEAFVGNEEEKLTKQAKDNQTINLQDYKKQKFKLHPKTSLDE